MFNVFYAPGLSGNRKLEIATASSSAFRTNPCPAPNSCPSNDIYEVYIYLDNNHDSWYSSLRSSRNPTSCHPPARKPLILHPFRQIFIAFPALPWLPHYILTSPHSFLFQPAGSPATSIPSFTCAHFPHRGCTPRHLEFRLSIFVSRIFQRFHKSFVCHSYAQSATS